MTRKEKLRSVLICPVCRSRDLQYSDAEAVCRGCEEKYPLFDQSPFLLRPGSEIRETYLKNYRQPEKKITFRGRILGMLRIPEERIWTAESIRAIDDILEKHNPDDPDHFVLNTGSGFEKVFRRAFSKYSDLFRIGLPHTEKVDVFGDAMDMPINDDSVDLLFSSSVIEHITDPELTVREIFRIIKPGGSVYIEIPFIRAHHWDSDFQRYTIMGIESLFGRHGFQLVSKGICSGPYTAMALFMRDFIVKLLPGRIWAVASGLVSSWLLHPIKYLDRLTRGGRLSRHLACNFYYVGRKPDKTAEK